ncbi:MAG: CRISPR-associated endonuclease Cas1 [Candidatus Neomarinimicrobiota bacterium]|jgi:CRISPR-associated protein Cas1|nr:CRISPR-associated endonuclease Cas1 [Candidatus Neomarinimicrobiota bacterium]
MQIILSTFGSSISRKGAMFEIYSNGERHIISPNKVSSILIFTGTNISSDAVELALQSSIDILILNKYGDPVGRFWHARMGSTTRIRRAQLQLVNSPAGIQYGLQWIRGKFENQLKLLTAMRERRTRLSAEITTTLSTIRNAIESIDKLKGSIEEVRQHLLGIEGSAGKAYWDIFAKFVPEHFAFTGRSRQPAKDEFNAMLNYGYGVLYGVVEKAVIVAGLDPYIGFVHTDNYNKVSLVFDVIEKYRTWVEETILNLFVKKAIRKDLFDKLANGYNLGAEGKKVFLPALNEYLDTQIHYKSRNVRRRDIIQLELHRFAQELLEKYNEND